jgi:hypothetical protein
MMDPPLLERDDKLSFLLASHIPYVSIACKLIIVDLNRTINHLKKFKWLAMVILSVLTDPISLVKPF